MIGGTSPPLSTKSAGSKRKRDDRAEPLHHAVITMTSLSLAERESLKIKLEEMGGTVVRELTSGVTHVIASESTSEKYRVAGKLGVPIVLPDWVAALHAMFHQADRTLELNKVTAHCSNQVISPRKLR